MQLKLLNELFCELTEWLFMLMFGGNDDILMEMVEWRAQGKGCG
jgi:hypothetical protein